MKPVVNRMVVCKIVVPSKIVAPFGISIYWRLFRNNEVAWNLSFIESSNVVTQCSSLTLLEELIHIKFVRDLNSNHSWDTPKKIFLNLGKRGQGLIQVEVTISRISSNVRKNLRLEKSCSLHKSKHHYHTLMMKPGCGTLLNEYGAFCNL